MIQSLLCFSAFLACSFTLHGCGGGGDDKPNNLVHVPGVGTLQGTTSDFSGAIALFRGIPYAKPPVGVDLRWRPPQPYDAWAGTRNATRFGSACFSFEQPEPQESEDCLFLNVAAPAMALGATNLPVMVYIHGGAYTSGDSSHTQIDSLVARTNDSVVVVSMNYRQNVFGFLGSSMLKGRSATDPGAFGNYGIDDQRMALTWVRDHIAAFGGDGNDITIFGESAGGNSVIQHLTQQRSFGLYSKAVIESGAYIGSKEIINAESQFKMILAATKCQHLSCLLSLSAKTLANTTKQLWLKNGNAFTFGPVIDGTTLVAQPHQLIDSGNYNNKVPVIIGSNRDEASFFLVRDRLLPDNATAAQVDALLTNMLPMLNASEFAEVKKIYSASQYSYPQDLGNYSVSWWMAMRMATDGITGLGACTVRRLARMMVQGKSPAVFAYMFNHPSQGPMTDMNEGVHIPATGARSPVVPHASELAYVFGWLEALSADGGETSLALSMSRYWQQFASKGDPNEPSLPAWPHYNTSDDAILGLDIGSSGIKIQHKVRHDACDFWEAHLNWPRSGSRAQVFV